MGDGKKRRAIKTLEDVPYYEFFRSVAAKHTILGNPFLEMEDLLQEVFCIWLEIERDYVGEPDLLKLIKRASRLHVITLIRDLYFGESRKLENFGLAMKADNDPLKQQPLEIVEDSLQHTISDLLSEDSKALLGELTEPSTDTLRIAEEHQARRAHLVSRGKTKHHANRVIITKKVLVESLQITHGRYSTCINEIRQVATKIREEIDREITSTERSKGTSQLEQFTNDNNVQRIRRIRQMAKEKDKKLDEVEKITAEEVTEEEEDTECFQKKLYAADVDECKECPDAPACEEGAVTEAESDTKPPKEKKEKKPRGKGIRKMAMEILADPAKVHMSYQEIADEIKAAKESATTAACISWYVNNAKKNHPDVTVLDRVKPKKEKPVKEEKPAKDVAKEAKEPEEKPKDKPKNKPKVK